MQLVLVFLFYSGCSHPGIPLGWLPISKHADCADELNHDYKTSRLSIEC